MCCVYVTNGSVSRDDFCFAHICFSQPPVPAAQTAVPAADSSPSSVRSNLSTQDFEQAQKLCRFAASALQYEDVPTAIDNLQKALALLQSK